MKRLLKQLIKFAEMFDMFFGCLNVSNSYVGKQSRNSFKNPYRSADNFRLKVRGIFISDQACKNGACGHINLPAFQMFYDS